MVRKQKAGKAGRAIIAASFQLLVFNNQHLTCSSSPETVQLRINVGH